MTIVPNPPAPGASRVVQTMREFKAGLLARETAQTLEMTSAWFEVERALTGGINGLVGEIEGFVAAGSSVTPSTTLHSRLARGAEQQIS